MYFERNGEGELEFTEAGTFAFFLFTGTFLAFAFSALRACYPSLSPTTGGFASIFIVTLLQAGREEEWKSRFRLMGIALLGYAWCVSLARVLTGGDVIVYAWGSLVFLVLLPWWALIDRQAGRSRSQTR